MAFPLLRQLRLNVINNGGISYNCRFYSAGGGKPIGFIGLGNMGNCMAQNLIKKGHSLVVYDIQSAATGPFEKLGAKVASTPAELASQVDRIVTMLPAGAHVRRVYGGDRGIFSGAQPGSIFMDSSTIEPDTSKDMAALAKSKGVTFLDTPVSGGVPAAEAGTLTFMVGADLKQDFKSVEPLLSCMGAKVVHCGGIGMGQAAKICNNMLLAIHMIGTSETYNLAIRMGLDPKMFFGIVNSSTGRNWSSDTYNPVPGLMPNVPSSNDYQGGFQTFLMTKDLGLSQSAANSTLTPTPLGALSHQIFRLMCNQGYKFKDFSSVFQFIQDMDKDK